MPLKHSSLENVRWSLIRRWSAIQKTTSASEQGLTIMECLVAIMLIGITVTMVTPPLLVATASRVQNRRAEQAAQVAQDEVDRINTLVQQGLHENRKLPSIATVTAGNFKAVDPPNAQASLLESPRRRDVSPCPSGSAPYGTYAAYTNQQLKLNEALPIDVDGDCTPEFFMQVFRTAGTTTTAELQKTDATKRRPARFDIGIRVYSTLAKNNLSAGQLTKPVEAAPILMTGVQGKATTRPLITIYKTISWGENSDTLCSSLKATDASKIATCQ